MWLITDGLSGGRTLGSQGNPLAAFVLLGYALLILPMLWLLSAAVILSTLLQFRKHRE
jgi:hypothetical protein